MFSYTFYRLREGSPTAISFRWEDIKWVRHEFGDLYFEIMLEGIGRYYVRGEFSEMEASYFRHCRCRSWDNIGELVGIIKYN